MNPACVIPARFDSSRFPGKLLEPLGSSEVLGMTYLRAVKSRLFSQVVVAAGDRKIAEYCKEKGIEFIETKGEFKSGSERVIWTANALDIECDVVNLQGDQPLFSVDDLENLNLSGSTRDGVSTLLYSESENDVNLGGNPVFATLNGRGNIITFSREKIPGGHGIKDKLFHIGIYYFPKVWLQNSKRSLLFHECEWSDKESLEQVNLLCSGVSFFPVFASDCPPEVNTRQDLIDAQLYWKEVCNVQ